MQRKMLLILLVVKKGILYIQTCLRCTRIIPSSEIIIYESTIYDHKESIIP